MHIEVDNLSKHMRDCVNSMHNQVEYMMKSGMTQRINLLQYMSVFQMAVAFVIPKTGHIHVVLVGLTAAQEADKNLCFNVITQFLMYFSDM